MHSSRDIRTGFRCPDLSVRLCEADSSQRRSQPQAFFQCLQVQEYILTEGVIIQSRRGELRDCATLWGRVMRVIGGSTGVAQLVSFDRFEAFDDVVDRAATVHHFEG